MIQLEYRKNLIESFSIHSKDRTFCNFWQEHKKELLIMTNLNLDPAIPILKSVYSPVHRRTGRDPVCMLRFMLLMVLFKVSSITHWVKQVRSIRFLGILAGFAPGDTPGVGTCYDFMRRIINGPYQKPCKHITRRTKLNDGEHRRNIKSEQKSKKDDQNPHQSQSEALIQRLLPQADQPRVNDFQRIMEDLLIQTALIPSIDDGLIKELENLTVSGDGSILESGASAHGKPTCSCRSEGIYKCQHDRLYSSPTATWCYDAYRDRFVFGDRYYLLVTHQSDHDFPLMASMPGGNESDYTLSLSSFDRFLKAAQENSLKQLRISAFCGDGHHDSYAHYDYFAAKQVIPVIPLVQKSKNIYPHSPGVRSCSDLPTRLDFDGTPLCPAGLKMLHLMYNKRKKTHVYCCPVKRTTHRNGKCLFVTHLDECPRKQDCAPQSTLAPLVYIKSETDRRLYPPLQRESKKFKALMKQRTATERCNYLNDTYHLDRSCRNVDYGLIRLTLVSIIEHAVIRYLETIKRSSEDEALKHTLGESVPALLLKSSLSTCGLLQAD
jgi:hypothetical protein